MKQLIDYTDEISRALRAIHPTNYLIAGITLTGELITDEASDSGTRFRPEDVVEQASFRGDSSPEFIAEKLALSA